MVAENKVNVLMVDDSPASLAAMDAVLRISAITLFEPLQVMKPFDCY